MAKPRGQEIKMDLFRRPLMILIIIVLTVAVVDIPVLLAQPQTPPVNYRIGAGDRIFLSVPQRPDLNRELQVSEQQRKLPVLF